MFRERILSDREKTLNNNMESLSKKLALLEDAKIHETRSSECFRLENEIKKTRNEMDRFEQELHKLEGLMCNDVHLSDTEQKTNKWTFWKTRFSIISGFALTAGIVFIIHSIGMCSSNVTFEQNNTGEGNAIQAQNVGEIVYGDKIVEKNKDNKNVTQNAIGEGSRNIVTETYNETNIQQPPSYRKATIAYNESGNPIGIADNPSPIKNAIELLGEVMKGGDVSFQEASPSKFLINSGTEISILESDDSSEENQTGLMDPIGFAKFYKIKILEGPHKDKTGWIHAGQVATEDKIITKNN